tara:strand:- start:10754 stop:17476 length:6723 start_codon:yes stop_codon:yes gene_type:complete
VTITWLHLSDLHRGQSGDATWKVIGPRFLEDLWLQTQTFGAPDLILFTGDLASRGARDEYQLVDDTLEEILDVVGGQPLIVPVPGNHDLVRPPASNVAHQTVASYFADSGGRRSFKGKDESYVQVFAKPFEEYHKWWERRVKPSWQRFDFHEGVLPGDFLLSFHKEDLRIALVGLNSAFLHLGDDADHNLAVECEQLLTREGHVKWVERHDAALLLMHHPFDWLHRDAQSSFHELIYQPDAFLCCLHGHMHQHEFSSIIGGEGDARRWWQGASLLGLEGYGSRDETRACGYSWGQLERTGPESAFLRRWPRLLRRAEGAKLEFVPGLNIYPQELGVPIRASKARSLRRRLKVAIVAVEDEFAKLLSTLLSRIEKLSLVETAEVCAAEDGEIETLEKFDVVVVLIGCRTAKRRFFEDCCALEKSILLKPRTLLNAPGLDVEEFSATRRILDQCSEVAEFGGADEIVAQIRSLLESKMAPAGADALLAQDVSGQMIDAAFEHERQLAHEAFIVGNFERAYDAHAKLLTHAEAVSSQRPTDENSLAWMTRCHLNLGACLINLGRQSEAVSELEVVDASLLSADAKLVYVKTLIAVHKIERAKEVASTGDAEFQASARAALELAAGRAPSSSPRDNGLVLTAARQLIAEGCLSAALDWVLEASRTARMDSPLERCQLASALSQVLERHAWANDLKQPLSAAQVDALLCLVEEVLGEPEHLAEHEHLADALLRSAWLVCARTFDSGRIRALQRLAPHLQPADDVFEEALQMATAGNVEGALVLLDRDSNWRRSRYQRIGLLEHCGDAEGALREALSLATDTPNCPLFEYEAGRRLLAAGQAEDALRHAERAFQLLPGIGQRELCAEALLATSSHTAAAQLVEGHTKGNRTTLEILARALERSSIKRAREAWLSYQELGTRSPGIEFRLSSLEARMGMATEAADRAWLLVTSSDAYDLGPDVFYQCALLQAVGDLSAKCATERIRAIADALRTGFPEDAVAERHYLQLWSHASDGKLPAPNWERLELVPGVQSVSEQQLLQALHRQHERARRVAQLFSQCHVPFAVLMEAEAELTGRFVAGLGSSSTLAGGGLCDVPSEELGLNDVSFLLVSDLELLLLARLELLSTLQEALERNSVSLILFEDVRQRLGQAELELSLGFPERTLRRHQDLMLTLASSRFEVVDSAPNESRWLGGHRPEGGISRQALVGQLRAQGCISAARAARALAEEPEEIDKPHGEVDELCRVVASAYELTWLHRSDLIDAVFEAAGPILIERRAIEELEARREQLRLDLDALDLYREVRRFLGALEQKSLLALSVRPEAELPSVAPLADAETFRAWLGRGLSFGVAAASMTSAVCVSADGVVLDLFSRTYASLMMRACQWSPPSLQKAQAEFRANRKKLRGIEWLIGEIVPGAAFEQATEPLLVWGVARVFDSSSLLELSKEYVRLQGLADTALEVQERALRDGAHALHWSSTIELAQIYAGAVPLALEGNADTPSLVVTLLKRWEQADVRGLDALLHFLVAQLFATPADAFVPCADDLDRFELSMESPLGCVLRALVSWSLESYSRSAALARIVASTLVLLDRAVEPKSPGGLQVGPAVLVAQSRPPTQGGIKLTDSAMSSLAVLSANWDFDPLAGLFLGMDAGASSFKVVLGDVIAHGVESISTNAAQVERTARVARYQFGVADGVEAVAEVPIEALVLRCSGERLSELALEMAEMQGQYDGQLYELWSSLAEEPEGVELKRRLARRIVDGPWRHVRSDARTVAHWARADVIAGGPQDIDELKRLLSEPSGFSGGSAMERVEFNFTSAWQHRHDWGELIARSCTLPGSLGLQILRTRLQDGTETLAEYGVAVLNDRSNAHFGHLWSSVLCLCIAAAREWSPPEGEPPLKLRIENLLSFLLEDESASACERTIARSCRLAVGRLGADPKDVVWLSFRLFSWLHAEMRYLSAEERDLVLADLDRSTAMRSDTLGRTGALDPIGLHAAGVDLRLSAVLNALAIAHEVVLFVGEGAARSWRLELSEDTLKMLFDLVARPFDDSNTYAWGLKEDVDLGWMGPVSAQELAMTILLNNDAQAFGALHEEVRIRWLQTLPTGHEEQRLRLSGALLGRVLLAAAQSMSALNAQERMLLRERLVVSAAPEIRNSPAVAVCACALLDVDVIDEAECWDITSEHIAANDIGYEVARTYFNVALGRAPEILQSRMVEIHACLESEEASPQAWEVPQGVCDGFEQLWGRAPLEQ